MSLRERIITLIITALLAVAFLGAAGWLFYREFRQIDRYVEEVRSEGMRLADQYLVRVRAIDVALLEYEINKDARSWVQFVNQSRALGEWLNERAGLLSTEEEIETLQRIQVAYIEFIQRARLYEGNRFVADLFVPKRLARAQLENTISRLLSLGNDLSNAHQARLQGLFEQTRRALQFIAVMTLGSAALLVSMLFWQGHELYKRYVAPLRLQMIEQSERLEQQEKMASLGMLAAGVAHEIRNPLLAIKARLYMLRKGVPPENASAQEDAETIHSELNRLEEIVRSFLKLARPPEPHLERKKVDRIVEETAALLQPGLAAGICLEVSARCNAEAELDEEQVKQCLINLIQNAADSMPQGGVVDIRTSIDRIECHGRLIPVVAMSVTDSGGGIAPEVQKRLFDPFFTTKASGTGLGLALTQRLMLGMGGQIAFQTNPGQGSTFKLYLPRYAEKTPDPAR